MSIKYVTEYISESKEYTDDEIVKLASARLNSLVTSRLVGCDLIKIKSNGNFTENGYYICSELTFLCQVGVDKRFEAD